MKKEFTLLTMIITFFLCINTLKAISNITINNNQLIPSFDKTLTAFNPSSVIGIFTTIFL